MLVKIIFTVCSFYKLIYLDQKGDNHQLIIDSDCNSSVDLLSRYVDSATKLTASRGARGELRGGGSSNEEEMDHEESKSGVNNMTSSSGVRKSSETCSSFAGESDSKTSSNSTLNNDTNSVNVTSRILNLYFETADKKLFMAKFNMLNLRFRKEKGLKDKLQIVQLM